MWINYYFDRKTCQNLVPADYHLWFVATERVTTSSTEGCFSLYVHENKKQYRCYLFSEHFLLYCSFFFLRETEKPQNQKQENKKKGQKLPDFTSDSSQQSTIYGVTQFVHDSTLKSRHETRHSVLQGCSRDLMSHVCEVRGLLESQLGELHVKEKLNHRKWGASFEKKI